MLLAVPPTMCPENLAIPFALCILLAALFAVMHRCSRLAGKNRAWKEVQRATQSNTRALRSIDKSLKAMTGGLHRVRKFESLLQEVLATQEKMLAAQKQTRDVVAKSGRALEHVNASLTSLADRLLRVDATLETLALSLAGRVDAPWSLPCEVAGIEACPTLLFLDSTSGVGCESTDHGAGAPRERPRMKTLSARRVTASQARSDATTADCAAARASARRTDQRLQGGPRNADRS